MNKPFIFFIALFSSLISFAQGNISGTIVDGESKQPLEGASVFAQNTTKGTTTNKEGYFKFHLEKGGYEIIISFTGYASRTINLQDLTSDRTFNLELEKADNTMNEVIIKNTNEVPDGWQKYGKFFIEHFIGSTPNADSCSLQNPEALKFYYYKKTDRLKVLATEPLQIQNRALGYNMRYELDSFVQYFNTDMNSYRGKCLYQLMDGNEQQQAKWKKARNAAYYGSRLHFLRSYYDSSLEQEGFSVDLNRDGTTKFDALKNPYDTAYYFFNDSTTVAELYFPAKASITYEKKAPEKRYLQQYKLPLNVPIQISYIDLTDAIEIKTNGYFTEQKSWTNQGYWSWKNLADQLPYDFEPE